MEERPIFVIGNRRSGTTMLRLMLASHPRIGVPPEGGFLVTLGWVYGSRKLTSADYGRFVRDYLRQESSQDWGLGHELLLSRLWEEQPSDFSELADATYRLYLSQKFPGKERWGDKTTWYLDFMPMLARQFPTAQFVHIYRDGRDVACSYRKMDRMPHSISRIALEWSANVETIRRNGRRLGAARFHEIRYEALVEQPEPILEQLCSFLGEQYSRQMIEFHEKNRRERLEPTRHMGWKQRTEEPVSTSSRGRWRAELTRSDVRTFETIAGPRLCELGYDAGVTTGRFQLVSSAGRVASAAYAVAWRTRQRLRPLKNRARYAFEARTK